MQSANLLHPPQFIASVVVRKTFRYKSSGSMATDQLSIKDILTSFVMATAATTANSLMTSFKLHAVEMWGPMASDLAPVTVSCEFNFITTSGLGGPSKFVSDTSMGSSACAHIRAVPPPGSTARFWQSDPASGDNLVLLNGPLNTVVDLDISFILNDSGTSGAAITLIAATAGIVYLRKPDVSSAGVLVPVSYISL